jgi:hypothetical protein
LEFNETVHQLFIDFKKTNETYSKVRIGKCLSANFHVQNGLKQGDALPPLPFNFALEYAIRNVQKKSGGSEIKWDTSAAGLS